MATLCWGYFICSQFVQDYKDYNLKRHDMKKHVAKLNVHQGVCNKGKIAELKKACILNKHV